MFVVAVYEKLGEGYVRIEGTNKSVEVITFQNLLPALRSFVVSLVGKTVVRENLLSLIRTGDRGATFDRPNADVMSTVQLRNGHRTLS